MPRKICELCHNDRIVYRVYSDLMRPLKSVQGYPDIDEKSKEKLSLEICQKCAEILVKENRIFNLRRILDRRLLTHRRSDEEYDEWLQKYKYGRYREDNYDDD